MKKNILLVLLGAAALLCNRAAASDARVEAAGDLTLVMTDETTVISPFNLGNPAGLALLPAQNRLDGAAPWSLATPAFDPSRQNQSYGSLSDLGTGFASSTLLSATNSAFQYQGLILFPASHWAFQVGGDWLHSGNQADDLSGQDKDLDRYRGIARTAYDFGPFALGTQVQWNQTDKVFLPTLAGGSGIKSGNGSQTFITSTSGLLVDFPLDGGPQPSRLRLGGVLSAPLPFPYEKDHFDWEFSGTDVALDTTYQVQSYLSGGPEAYLDIPGSFQAVLLVRFGHSDLDLQQASSNSAYLSGFAPYNLSESGASSEAFVYKWTHPLEGKESGSLRLKAGGFLGESDGSETIHLRNGQVQQTSQTQNWQSGIGLGLEKPEDFTLGLQASLESQGGNNETSSILQKISYEGLRISLGGERWLSPAWALRLGFHLDHQSNGGDTSILQPYYTLDPGGRVVDGILTTGVGYQDPHFRSDFLLWYGQPFKDGSPQTDDFYSEAGIQWAGTVLF
jgi:hypothetical protein